MPRFSAQQRENINQKLLCEGERLFNEKGLTAVTAEDIACACDIAKGTYYHFYENKEHLYMTINNRIQEAIFSNLKQYLNNSTEYTSSRFYEALCCLMEHFLEHPLVMDVHLEIWAQLKVKAPRECIAENDARDLELVTFLSESAFHFRYDLETTTKLLQMQFVQLAYIKKETESIELMKILLLALARQLIQEETI